MKKLISKLITTILVLSISITLFGILPVSASSNTVTQYYLDESGVQIKEPTDYVVDDVYVWKFDGYEYLSCAGEVKYEYCKTIDAYVEGYSDGTFKPYRGITRAEAAKMLCQFIDVQKGSVPLSSDVVYNEWYYKFVSALFNAGYLKGYPDGTFRPNNTMNRAEFIKLIVLVGGITGNAKEDFKDVPQSHWAYSYISTASAAGLVSGYGDGTFGPDNVITRAEAVTVINHLYNYSASDSAKDSVESPYSDVDTDFWGYDAIMIASGAIGRNIKGNTTNYYFDESGIPFSVLHACFASNLTAPEIDGYTCIYAKTVNNYYYKTATNTSE